MYLMRKINLAVGEALPSSLPMGACQWMESLGQVSSIEIWATEFSDPGDDRTEIRAFNGTEDIGTYVVPGY